MTTDTTAAQTPLLKLDGLSKTYTTGLLNGRSHVHAVAEVDLEVHAGETVGLVGESGCGKSSLGKLIVRLAEPTSGRVVLDGHDITHLSHRKLRRHRRKMQIVFQDPFASLNPRMTVRQIVTEPLRINRIGSSAERDRRAADLVGQVGLPHAFLERKPGEMSGGQRQRVGIARALALEPRLLVLDEAVSALDVSVQAQVVNLLQDLQRELGLAYVFISHDLSVVRQVADRVAVMYLGRIVEFGGVDELYASPRHPYTSALLSAIPVAEPGLRDARPRRVLHGDLPSPSNPPSGCSFRTRCWRADDLCAAERPELLVSAAQTTLAACHHPLSAAEGVTAEVVGR